jgi:hypothetical protein
MNLAPTSLLVGNPNKAHIVIVRCNLEKVEEASLLGKRLIFFSINYERIKLC